MAFYYSKNRKLNALLNEIEDELREMCDTEDESLHEIRRHMESFPHETDYRIARNGNLRCYIPDVRKLYREAGYKSTENYSASRIWGTYCRQVGYVARELMKRDDVHPENWK